TRNKKSKSTDQKGNWYNYKYDRRGNLTEIIDSNIKATGANNRIELNGEDLKLRVGGDSTLTTYDFYLRGTNSRIDFEDGAELTCTSGLTYTGGADNTFIASGGSTVRVKGWQFIGTTSFTEAKDPGTEINIAGTLQLGTGNGNNGNGISARNGGIVQHITTLSVGHTSGTSGNYARTAGGDINCTNLFIYSNNGLKPVLTKNNGTGKITVFGNATFQNEIFVTPFAEPGASSGIYEIMTVKGTSTTPENLQLDEDVDTNIWRLKYDPATKTHSLKYSYPATIVIIK
ncbi:MAG: hypothetical protein FWG05_03500, partial [Kiritimatiellaeota bacterium]|nr:hypothetical protein [Kiritimatiellota bacterium]